MIDQAGREDYSVMHDTYVRPSANSKWLLPSLLSHVGRLSIPRPQIRNCHSIIVCFSCTDKNSVVDLKYWLARIAQNRDESFSDFVVRAALPASLAPHDNRNFVFRLFRATRLISRTSVRCQRMREGKLHRNVELSIGRRALSRLYMSLRFSGRRILSLAVFYRPEMRRLERGKPSGSNQAQASAVFCDRIGPISTAL